jgi:hypothetical protein
MHLPALNGARERLGFDSRTLKDLNCGTLDCAAETVTNAAEDQGLPDVETTVDGAWLHVSKSVNSLNGRIAQGQNV